MPTLSHPLPPQAAVFGSNGGGGRLGTQSLHRTLCLATGLHFHQSSWHPNTPTEPKETKQTKPASPAPGPSGNRKQRLGGPGGGGRQRGPGLSLFPVPWDWRGAPEAGSMAGQGRPGVSCGPGVRICGCVYINVLSACSFRSLLCGSKPPGRRRKCTRARGARRGWT